MCHVPAQEEVSPETGWFAGYKEAGGCRCNCGNPFRWKRVTKSSSCVLYADPYSTTLLLPRALVWSVFHFPTKGAAGGEKGLVDEWSSAGHKVPAADLSIGKLLTLWLRSACAGCLLYRVLIFQRFLGMNGCCEQREWGSGGIAHLGQLQPAEYTGCSTRTASTQGMCAGVLRCASGHTSLPRV